MDIAIGGVTGQGLGARTALEALDMTSVGAGGPTISQLVMLVSLSTRLMYRSSRGVNMAMAVPDLPARPVRPERCRNDSTSCANDPACHQTSPHCTSAAGESIHTGQFDGTSLSVLRPCSSGTSSRKGCYP